MRPPRAVRLRAAAAADIERAVAAYAADAGDVVAGRFIDAWEQAVTRLGRAPGIGIPRFAVDLEIPDLRCLTLRRFPYAVFYREDGRIVDVWRALHTRRDIPATFHEL